MGDTLPLLGGGERITVAGVFIGDSFLLPVAALEGGVKKELGDDDRAGGVGVLGVAGMTWVPEDGVADEGTWTVSAEESTTKEASPGERNRLLVGVADWAGNVLLVGEADWAGNALLVRAEDCGELLVGVAE